MTKKPIPLPKEVRQARAPEDITRLLERRTPANDG